MEGRRREYAYRDEEEGEGEGVEGGEEEQRE